MSKRQVAVQLFNTHLASKATLGDTKFRNVVITNIMKDAETTHASAAGLYNHAKKKAELAGDVTPFGRVTIEANTKAKAKAEAEAPKQDEPELLAVAVVDTDNNIVSTHNSKSTAYRARNKANGERVMLTSAVNS